MSAELTSRSTRSLYISLIIGIMIFTLMNCGGGGGGGNSDPAPAPTPTPNISTSQSSLDFAGVVLNNSVDQTVEITNTGNANLTIGQISNSGPNPPFSIAADACSNKALTPSQTCSLRVSFAPTNQDSFTGTLSIPSNDPDSKVVNISLKGTGYGLNVWINKVDSSSCPSISVDVTAADPTSPGSLLDSLTKENFKVYQDGKQVQDITATAIQSPTPVSVVLALDWSGSEEGVINTITAAANSFINQLNDGDYAAICKFRGAIGFYPDTLFISGDTAGRSALNSYITAPFPEPAGTLLFTALLQSIDRAAQGTTDKRAVIVLSDGIADGDNTGLDEVIAGAIQKGIPLFTIYYIDPNFIHYTSDQIASGMLNMQRLAGGSGGQYYNGLTGDLTAVFGQIANVFSNKYTLTYKSSTCSGTISLNVQADWNNGSIVLHGEDSGTITF
jgi:VWFA-related protein